MSARPDVDLCIDYLRTRALHEPNLFRVHRPVKHIRQLWQRLSSGNAQDQRVCLAEEKDAHLVAGLLLWRLREREPPFPFARYGDVIATDVSSDSHEALIAALRSLVHELTPEQWRTVKGIVTFLAQLASCAQMNDSSIAALAFVFAPVLSRPPGSAYMSVRHVQDLAQIRKVMHTLVEHHKEVFAETHQARPSHSLPTPSALETPAWELSAVDELVRLTVGMLFDKSSPEASGEVMRWKEAHPSKGNVGAKGEASVVFFTWEPTIAAGARERRRMVTACRTLRAQIKRFEEEFISQHGHAPKGADRAPLASTYVQYREWKRNIRDHAAVQIQAFYRGSVLRGKLHDVQQKLNGEEANSENKLSAVNHRTPDVSAAPRVSSPGCATGALVPEQPLHVDEGGDLSGRDIASLIHEKKMVKAQLKAFDARFFADHGRMPSKSEKEPIRKLYELYHKLKSALASHEKANGTA